MKVLTYHADNGVFEAWEWVHDCDNLQQLITFVGVGTHHANGAECRIQQLQGMTWAMLIHANKQWPNAITANLWLYDRIPTHTHDWDRKQCNLITHKYIHKRNYSTMTPFKIQSNEGPMQQSKYI